MVMTVYLDRSTTDEILPNIKRGDDVQERYSQILCFGFVFICNISTDL